MSNPLTKIGEVFLDLIETLVIALSIFLVVYLFFLQPHQVNGQSMVPNFQNGEYLLTDKVSYHIGNPVRGQVVVFHAPPAANCPEGTGCDFIKRVIAVPGETVAVVDGHFVVNGEELPESYIPSDFYTEAGNFTEGVVVELGEDEYFVSGDNRPYSSDSRAWGPIHKSDIIGRVFFRYWPFTEMGTLPTVSYSL